MVTTRAGPVVAEYVVNSTGQKSSMRILLIHNPKAGDCKHSKNQLIASLAAFGHQVVYRSTKKRGWKKAFDKSTDLVIAAGGDGTVHKVAWRLMESAVPMSILALGTANNLARSLGFTAPPDEIIAHLDRGTSTPFDVGMARGSCGKRFFLEAVGGGLLADYVRGAKLKEDKEASTKRRMLQQVSWLRKISAHYPARQWNISIDGEDISGRYVLWDAMNIRSAGPALKLAPRAATDDGQLDFVAVREHARELFTKYLDAWLDGKRSRFPLRVRKFRELQITRRGATMHFDGKTWPNKKHKPKNRSPIEITLRPAALTIWRPAL
jgi:diacylglycerol kinase (ATP)